MVASLPKSKAKKAQASGAETSASSPIAHIAKLEAQLLAKPYNPNSLLGLLGLARHDDPQIVHKAIWALYRVFVAYINEGIVGQVRPPVRGDASQTTISGEGDDAAEVKHWVRDRLMEYVELLSSLLRDSEEGLRSSAVKLLFSLLQPLSMTLPSSSNSAVMHVVYFRILLDALFFPTPSLRGSQDGKVVPDNQVDLEDGVLPDDVAELVQEEYWAKYDDIRWMFFREARHCLQQRPLLHHENLLSMLLPLTNLPKETKDINAFFVPSFATPPPSAAPVKKGKPVKGKKKSKKGQGEVDETPDWMEAYETESEPESEPEAPTLGKRGRPIVSQLNMHGSVYSIPSHQLVYSALWETVFSMDLEESWTRKILVGLHGEQGILGHMRPARRVRVADWLGNVVDGGGAGAMLAMNGLYVLMTKYNLDYPQFYQRLYSLLDRHVLHVKYRARFFRLLDTFLASSLLPAALVASFIKRLARLTLTAPPAAIIMVIPFIYNLFKRHPRCMAMIQRVDGDATDPYDERDPSPLTSKAIQSSLWELAALQKHYLASVATLSKVFTEVFTKPEYNMEDFLDHGYTTLFDNELKRKLKYAPALSAELEGEVVARPFPGAEVTPEERAGRDIVSQLWSF